MQLRFYRDPETGRPHVENHGVSTDEVRETLTRPVEDRPGSSGSRVAIGQTEAGRFLRIIYKREGSSLFIITAYDLPSRQLKALRRRRKR